MRYFIIILGLMLILISCQNTLSSDYPEYYRTYNEVQKLEKGNRIQEAFKMFKKAENLVDFIPVQHLLTGRSLAMKTGDCKSAQEYFQKAVNNGFEYKNFEFNNELCPDLKNSSIVPIKFDEDYRHTVNVLFEKDQAVRTGEMIADMREVDSLNIERLLSLIEDKGYPNSKLIGESDSNHAFILLLHSDADIGNKKLKPIIEKAYSEGMIEPSGYAWIVDRRRNWGPKKLDPYYFQIPTKRYFEMSATEIAIIDERRDSIGLKPLKEMNIRKTENGGISIQN